jgi:hypothetical protein
MFPFLGYVLSTILLGLNGFFWNRISLAHGVFIKFLSKPMAMVSYVVGYYLKEMHKKYIKSY